MKIFLDDVREPQMCVSYMYTRIGKDNPIYLEDWLVVRNFDEFKLAVETGIDEITHVSFDHDLGNVIIEETAFGLVLAEEEKHDEKTGVDCAKFLKEMYKRQGKELPIMYVHSTNPVGTQNIINVFK